MKFRDREVSGRDNLDFLGLCPFHYTTVCDCQFLVCSIWGMCPEIALCNSRVKHGQFCVFVGTDVN